MSLTACPTCGATARNAISSSWFPVFSCQKCDAKYCFKCDGTNGGNRCPRCSSTAYTTLGKVYARG